MKKNILTWSFLMVVGFAQAQRGAIGINLPFVYHPEYVSHKNDLRFYGVGLSGMKYYNKKLFVQLNLNFLASRTKYLNEPDYRGPDPSNIVLLGTLDREENISYFSIPLTLNYKVFNTDGINLLLSGGVNFNYLIRIRNVNNTTYMVFT